jgi:hypothetical protein
MTVEQPYATIDTGLDTGGVIVVGYPAPIDPTGLALAQPDPNGYNPPPPQPIDHYGTGYPVPGGQVMEPPRTVDTVPNLLTLQNTGPVPSPNLPTSLVAQPTNSSDYGWVWLAAAAAGVYLISNRSQKRAGVSGSGNSLLVPVVLVGGIAALYLTKKAATVTPVPVQAILPDSGSHGTVSAQ